MTAVAFAFQAGVTGALVPLSAPVPWPRFVDAVRELVAREYPCADIANPAAVDFAKRTMAAVVPARFDASESRRKAEHVRGSSIVGCDLDGCAPDAWSKAIEYLKNTNTAAVAHTSATDGIKPGVRKGRIFVLADRELAPHEIWPARVAVATALGLRESLDEATKDASRIFFCGRLAGAPPREFDVTGSVPVPIDALLVAFPTASPANEASSVHDRPANAPIAWSAGGDHEQAMTPALVALLVPEYARGGRHEKVRALGAVLAQNGWSDAGITSVVAQLPSDKVDARVEQAIDAAKLARAGERVHQMGTLRKAFGDRLAKHVADLATQPEVAELEARTTEATGTASTITDSSTSENRRTIDHDPRVDETITWLAAPGQVVFQRAGKLVTVTRDARDDGKVWRPDGAPTIRELVPARLREIIRVGNPERGNLAPEVLARGEWEGIRPLDAIVSYPVMRRDGSLLTTDGYDGATRTLAQMTVAVDVPDAPTHADAKAALDTLTELVADFPFADKGRASWLAMLLTLPARPAIDGPTPLGLLEASQRGSGKTLLADVISTIVTGEPASRRVAPKTREEWDKVLFSILLAGDPLVLFDNVTTMLVSDALDAVLTGTTYAQRVLGVNEDRRVAVRTVFLASMNNARLSTDLVRRSLACRLEPGVEQPELRSTFTHADLLGHVRRERARYLGAALTILRAYVVAGRPDVEARPMGSYRSWCRTVRDALVWAGGDDPAVTQDALRETADVERDELGELLIAWHETIGDRAVTGRELLDAAGASSPLAAFEPSALLDALHGITPGGAKPTKHTLGNRLRTLRGQIVGGLVLQEGPKVTDEGRGGRRTWRVSSVDGGARHTRLTRHTDQPIETTTLVTVGKCGESGECGEPSSAAAFIAGLGLNAS